MAVDAVKAVRKTGLSSPSPALTRSDGKARYPIENIGIIKAHGQSALESELVDGLVLSGSRAAQGMPLRVNDAHVLVLDFPLQRYKTQMGVEVKVSNPDRLEEIKKEEGAKEEASAKSESESDNELLVATGKTTLSIDESELPALPVGKREE